MLSKIAWYGPSWVVPFYGRRVEFVNAHPHVSQLPTRGRTITAHFHRCAHFLGPERRFCGEASPNVLPCLLLEMVQSREKRYHVVCGTPARKHHMLANWGWVGLVRRDLLLKEIQNVPCLCFASPPKSHRHIWSRWTLSLQIPQLNNFTTSSSGQECYALYIYGPL